MINIAVFISGRGTNLQSIIDSVEAGKIPVNLKVVISNNKDAYGLTRAEKAGIETRWVDPDKFNTDKKYEDELLRILEKKEIELVALAGFMRLLTPYFLHNFSGKAMNIHPSLLPSFRGLHAQKQAVDYGVKVSGCTVHFVDEGMDTGPIILQKTVPVYDSDDEDSLADRILEKEHEIYPEAIRLYAEDKLELKGRKVIRMEEKYNRK
ncbi:MAG: phosphoribosylglycinamide formyltransferase [bacterium]